MPIWLFLVLNNAIVSFNFFEIRKIMPQTNVKGK